MAFALLLFPNQHNLRKTKSLAAGGEGGMGEYQISKFSAKTLFSQLQKRVSTKHLRWHHPCQQKRGPLRSLCR